MMQNILNDMLKDLSKHKRDKKDLLEMYINDRLSKSLETYYSELSNSLAYLVKKNELRVLKNMAKL